ncbi:hypothetical protein Mx8p39 [Myxococcus phage Mx8]|uniref:p39 n=1 Tax=Myxococcus phage Mx8 TaxID=49964 RepID=Q94MT0_9CAUD|nr:hypothetical protein Mx8p39 [Myxococcus phage Mx8]AAK94374.1 p39 [Myxococcus phage Mx8]
MTDFLIGMGLAVAFVYGFVDLLSGFGVTRLLLRRAFRRVPEHLRRREPREGGAGAETDDAARQEQVWLKAEREARDQSRLREMAREIAEARS